MEIRDLVGRGRDSTALSQPCPEPVEDLEFVLGPDVRAVVPMSSKGLIGVYHRIDFVYYRDLEQLRNIINLRRARFSTETQASSTSV